MSQPRDGARHSSRKGLVDGGPAAAVGGKRQQWAKWWWLMMRVTGGSKGPVDGGPAVAAEGTGSSREVAAAQQASRVPELRLPQMA